MTGLFASVPDDVFRFGQGPSFQPKLVSSCLGLKKEDVSRLADVPVKSVWYGRYESLRKFIINAMLEQRSDSSSPAPARRAHQVG